jgi:hypothetical protein
MVQLILTLGATGFNEFQEIVGGTLSNVIVHETAGVD